MIQKVKLIEHFLIIIDKLKTADGSNEKHLHDIKKLKKEVLSLRNKSEISSQNVLSPTEIHDPFCESFKEILVEYEITLDQLRPLLDVIYHF